MRVSSDTSRLTIAPGSAADVALDIVNTGTVIDGITAGVVGLPITTVTTRPAVLPLFPDTSGTLTVTIGLPSSFPAGQHPMTIEVRSRQADIAPEFANIDLTVPRKPALGAICRPEVVRARRSGNFIVTVTNRGNVLLDVDLAATDPDKSTTAQVLPATVSLPPGGSAEAVITIRVRRKWMGTEADHALSVTVEARAVGPDSVPTGGEEASAADPAAVEPLLQQVPITFRQRPLITRGVLTALILVAIIAVWAAVFLFGLSKVFASDPLTKTAPASFFAATPSQHSTSTASGSTASGGAAPSGAAGSGGASGADGAAGSGGASGADAAPAGALPKTGTLPAGVGGTISGTVTAASSGQPVGRILVEALRVKSDGSTVRTASAATQADGTYQVAGLFPGPYILKLSAAGFTTSYFPATTSEAKAHTVTAKAGTVSTAGNAVITGKTATITGNVDPGDTNGAAVTTVSARLLQQADGKNVTIPDVHTDPKNNDRYVIPDLPAPGNYELTFTTPGYEDSTVKTVVTGGAQRFESTVILSAGTAQIAGTVTDGSAGLGGVTVSTTVDGKKVSTGTPTDGDVGHFVLDNLPTPATYVVTVSKSGYGKTSQVIDLAPGKPQNDLKITLRSGTGVVAGHLRDAAGTAVGGATVTVGGMSDPPSTVTLTNGDIGAFRLAGLPAPGSYTLTFSLPGFADQTVPVTLAANKPLKPITVTMAASVGSITGTVHTADGTGLANATVTATDGQKSWPVITTGNGAASGIGHYTIAALPTGVYTVTASNASGDEAQTAIVTVAAGAPHTLDFELDGGN